MIPIEKVQTIIARHDELEKELSSGKIDAKLFAQKSKEYSSLGGIILIAKSYVNFDQEKKDLQQIIQDKNNDSEVGSKPCQNLLINCGVPFPPQNLLSNVKVISQKTLDLTPHCFIKTQCIGFS